MSEVSIDLSEFGVTDRSRCVVGLGLTKMSEEQRAKFEAALVHPNISSTNIVRVWEATAGGAPGRTSIAVHRRKECACG